MPQYKINIPLNGIEIYFDVKPDEFVLQKLRVGKWRWHNGKKCWYNKIGEVTMQFANDICTPLPNFQSMFPPKQPSINNETTPQTTSYNLVSDGNTLSHVTITKNGEKYTVTSTNNQLICSDCHRMLSVHAPSCPFCGCPIEHILQSDFNELTLKHQEERRLAEEKLRKEAEEHAHAIRMAQQQEREGRRKRELEKQQQAEAADRERRCEIERICANYAIETSIVERIIKSGISPDKLRNRISRILYYRKAYPSAEIALNSFITNETIEEYIARYKEKATPKTKCIGVCSNCSREDCLEHK